MTISFDDIPGTLRIPFVGVEINASNAAQGSALQPYRHLIIGQKIASGTATANTLVRVTNDETVATLAGRGSILHRQARAHFANNQFTETWIGVLDDNGAGVAKIGTITITGPATAAGTIAFYCGGVRLTAAVADAASVTDMALAVTAAITAAVDLPITAAAALGVVTWTFRNKGLEGSSYDIRDSFNFGEELPAGVAIAYAETTAGATNPVLTTLIAAMGDIQYNILTHPYTDATSLSAIEAELLRRFGGMLMVDGVAIASSIGSHSTLVTLGDGRNSKHSEIIAQPGSNPMMPPMEFSAGVAALVSKHGATDPARPMQTLVVAGMLSGAETDEFTSAERDLLLHDGIATSRATPSGGVQFGRMITTSQTNVAGGADASYLDVNTLLTLMYLRYSWRNRILAKYPRHKLASNGTRLGPGQSVVTPKLILGEAYGWFRDMEDLGLVEDFDTFKANATAERNGSDPNRVDVLLPPDLINQLIVTATQIAFRL